ncbi:RHS repeat-associated core domain-containing protein [Xanthomonas oryzae]|uniref:RHS repeat-associated core domain-containing protein n=1 Tax=Xanthomonas oryzae TaxID=347 RepID=UPI000A92DB5A|nr:RHS repeat-associated core domain-containing protein [Xanthomonas oryzae]QBG91778.1 wall-associated protein [Xanthomonas oryzae]
MSGQTEALTMKSARSSRFPRSIRGVIARWASVALFMLCFIAMPSEARRTCPDGSTAGPNNQCPPADRKENDSKDLGGSVPTTMVVGQSYTASLSFQNTGRRAWTTQDGYRLGSQGPTNNTTWGTGRVELASSVAPNSSTTFNFTVRAPLTPGSTLFQWEMVRDGVAWFGDVGGTTYINVLPSVIKGGIDGVSYTAISGWACSTNLNRSIDVHMYLGGPAGSGTFAVATTASLPSDSGIASACSASGSNYRFSFPIDENFIIQNGGKAIYIHGLSPVGASNDTISGSGAVAVPASVIKGRIEGIQDNKAIVGWACSAGLRRSIDVHMYAGGPAGSGTIAAIASANLASEPGVASACSSSGSNYRFSIPVTEDLIRSQGGKPFYIHGISPVGRDNSLIDGSGALSIPAMQRNAAFVSQNMPAQLPTGRSVTGSVRFTNTGNVTWRQGQGYRAVLVGDTRGWSPGEVGLPSDVPPGGSVDFNFSLRAPLGAGGYNLRWRMRDGAGDFGNESSNQVVQVVAPPPVEHGVGLAARSYVYDANQQLCKVIEPESGSTVMAYDAAGNLAWSASGLDLPSTTSCDLDAAAASGRQVVRTYDTRNRLKTLRFPDKNGNQDWSYTPDGLPAQVMTWNDAGSSSVVNSYNYNKRRMLTSESSGQTGWYTWSIGYGYDANGALASQAYPTGLSINYAPNALGQPTDVRDQFGNVYASDIGYYPNGAARQFTYGNGVSHSLVLNGRQMPQQVRDSNVASFEYQYDANGNVGAIIDQQRGTGYNRYMVYDGLDRLMEAGSERFGGDNWNRYTYDVLDNILTAKLPGVQESNFWYDAKNRLTNVQNNAGATTVGLSYDPQGNLKNKNGQAYTFDYGNRLRDVTGKESYAYDAYGRRTIAGRPTTRTLQVYTQAGQLFYTEASGKGNMEYVYLNGSLLATRNSGTIKFQHTDALGSPIAVTDTAGQVVERTDYQPYGSPIGKTVDGIGYTGHAMDGATGLTYMQQRYYDQDLGRFLSVDPVAADSVLAANFNRYWYANNNPYKFTDPDGRQTIPTENKLGSSDPALISDFHRAQGEHAEITLRASLELFLSQFGDGPGGALASAPVALVRGVASEIRVLDAIGEVKNTEKIVTSHGSTIPDFQNVRQVGEIKDTKRVSDTAQLKAQREHANNTGRDHVVVTGENTKVSKTVEQQSKVIRRDDLGPLK